MSEDEYNRLLKEFAHKVRTSITLRQSFDRLIKAGMKTGRTDREIGDDIRKELRGELSDRTIRRYLPDSMKHEEKKNVPVEYADSVRIPEPEPEPEKEFIVEKVDEYIADVPRESEVNTDPILDLDKFRQQLRILLVNGGKVRLKINRLNEVVAIG